VGLDVVANRFSDPRAESVFMGAARAGWNPVHIAADVLVGRLRPLKNQVETRLPISVQYKRRLVNRFGGAFSQDFLEVVAEPFLVLENVLRPVSLIFERNPDAPVDVANHLEPLTYYDGIELDSRKYRRVGVKVDCRSRPSR
jgi:hypothetical protein